MSFEPTTCAARFDFFGRRDRLEIVCPCLSKRMTTGLSFLTFTRIATVSYEVKTDLQTCTPRRKCDFFELSGSALSSDMPGHEWPCHSAASSDTDIYLWESERLREVGRCCVRAPRRRAALRYTDLSCRHVLMRNNCSDATPSIGGLSLC